MKSTRSKTSGDWTSSLPCARSLERLACMSHDAHAQHTTHTHPDRRQVLQFSSDFRAPEPSDPALGRPPPPPPCVPRPPARPPVTRRARRPDGRTASAAPRGAVDRKAPPATSRQPASVSAVATCLPTLSLSRGLAGSSVNAPLIITQDWALGGAGPVRRGNDQPERTRDA